MNYVIFTRYLKEGVVKVLLSFFDQFSDFRLGEAGVKE